MSISCSANKNTLQKYRRVFLYQKKKVCPVEHMVQVVGVEPTRFPTCPLNKRVCHSATPAFLVYSNIIYIYT